MIFLILAFLSASSAQSTPLKLTVPKVSVSEYHQRQAPFNAQTQAASQKLFPQGKNLTALAPFSGSKISTFAELNVQTLVMLSWEKPGSIKGISKAFDEKTELRSSLEAAYQSGSMSSTAVMNSPVNAQILGRLFLEMNVTNVKVTYKKVAGSNVKKESEWDGKTVSMMDPVLLTEFSFNYQNTPRKIIFISWQVRPDSKFAESLPIDTLRALSPKGFDWGYLSADGLVFYSAKRANGAERASQELTDLLSVKGAMILDYPLSKYCWAGQDYGNGLIAMLGRMSLEEWGFTLAQKIPMNEVLFGYSGLRTGDEVRIYRNANPDHIESSSTEFETLGTYDIILN